MSDQSPAERLGTEALAFIEHLQDCWQDASFELGAVGMIAEVIVTQDDESLSIIDYSISDERRWAQVGLLRAALKSAEAELESVELDD